MITTTRGLQRDVLDELQWEPSIDSARIGVAVENGVVVLSGHVRSLLERATAEQVAKRVRGVAAIANELDVDLLADDERDDVHLAQAVEQALQWNVMVPHERLHVVVSKGWVTVDGEVPFAFQRRAAQQAVEQIVGVRGLTNRITVHPEVSPKDLQHRLTAALHRRAQLEAAHIHPHVDGTRIVLTGTVRSWTERDDVQDAAWSAPGVTEVDNRLAVAP